MSTPKKARTRKKPPPPEPFGFVCDAFEMRQAIATVKPAVARRGGSLPVLSGIRIEADETGVTFTASNLELTIAVPLRAADVSPGRTVLPTATTDGFVKSATKTKTGRLVVKQNGEDVTLTLANRTRKIRSFDPDEFPRLPQIAVNGATIDSAVLADVFAAASTDDCRPILTGVLIGDGELAATDSYRLYTATGPSHADLGITGDRDIIVPRYALATVIKRGGSPSVGFTDREVTFQWTDGTAITSRLIEGEFPNYRGLRRTSHPNVCTFDRADLIDALRSIASLSGPEPSPVKIRQSVAGVTLTITRQDIGEETITMTRASYEGTDGMVAFNPGYLLDAVRSMSGDTVMLRTTDEQKPAFLSEQRILGGERGRLLMPVRVA